MGVEFRDDEAAFRGTGDHDLMDSYLVYRARDTLRSVASTNLNALSGSVAYIDNDLQNELLSAATSSGKYVDRCLEMLTRQFCPPDSFPHSKILARKDEVLSRVHSALKYIADMMPLSPLRLGPIVLQRLTQYRCSKRTC